MESLAEETKTVGIESDKETLEKTAMKKKVRVVKRIVKKKIIKKVPKRVSVVPNCNDLEKVASPNPSHNVPMEIEKHNVDVDDVRDAENMKESEVNDRVVVSNESCRDESETSELLTASVLGDQNRTEMYDIDNTDVEEHGGEEGAKEDDENCLNLDVGVSKRTKIDENEKEPAGMGACAPVKIEVGSSHDVKGEEGMREQVEKREDIDLKPSEATEDQEGVKELVENSGTNAQTEQAVNERRVVASGWLMKQRTKIFIHGLDKQTKEEDLRKVFEQVGEVVEVKIITNLRTGKNRGFGFVRYASEAHAKAALTKYHTVEIRGRPCRTASVEGNGTILLNNIDKKWNSEYVLALLQKIGVENIDEVSVVADPENTELNRGFAFLELETRRDALLAYRKLQNKNVFGKNSNIKVSWAELSANPVEEEMHNVKSVYAEHIPSSWDEGDVKDHFKIFGEVESIALAKNLRSTKRNDFAFINYKTSEAALSCIKAFTCKQSTNDNDPKAQVKVSLAKSVPKGKQIKTISDSAAAEPSKIKQKAPLKTISNSAATDPSKVKLKANQANFKPYKPKNTRVSSISRHEDARNNGGSSTTSELVQLLREQASWKLSGAGPTTGMSAGHHQPPSGRNLPYTRLGSESLHHGSRAYYQSVPEIPNAAHPRSIGNSVGMASFPRYDVQRGNYTTFGTGTGTGSGSGSGSFIGVEADPRFFQTRNQATYHGNSSIYRQMY